MLDDEELDEELDEEDEPELSGELEPLEDPDESDADDELLDSVLLVELDESPSPEPLDVDPLVELLARLSVR